MTNVQSLSSTTPFRSPDDYSTATAYPLTDAQCVMFWSWVHTSLNAGLARARVYVERDDEYDVVDDAVTAMLDEMTGGSTPITFPATLSEFRGRFFTKIRDRGLWYRGDGKPDDHPMHTFWGRVERHLPARFSPDRPLWKIFEPLDEAGLDVAQDEPEPYAFVVRGELPAGLRSYPPLDWPTYNAELRELLQPLVLCLALGQAGVIMDTYQVERGRDEVEPKRKEIAKGLHISPKTYDTQHRRALDALRPEVVEWARRKTDPQDKKFDPYDENPWPDIILAMERRRLERRWRERPSRNAGRAPAESDDRRAA